MIAGPSASAPEADRAKPAAAPISMVFMVIVYLPVEMIRGASSCPLVTIICKVWKRTPSE